MNLYHTPLLLDYVKVCIKMPQDEREQLEAFTGQPYDVDGAAVGNFMAPGFKFAIKETPEAEPIAVGGFVYLRPGVLQDFMLTTPEAWTDHWFAVTRICQRLIRDILRGHAHRVQCICLASREAKNSRWYEAIGYNREATLYGYAANGADAVIYSKVRHG